MTNLKDILYKVNIVEVIGTTDIEVKAICFDSREVEKDGLFIAVRGTQADGHDFIEDAIEGGATAIVGEKIPDKIAKNISYISVQDSSMALGVIADNFYDNPSTKLELLGITGTNGKTTLVTLLYDLFKDMGHKVGLLSTIVNRINEEEVPASYTTPDAIQINKYLSKMVKAGCGYCFIEVSSHAIHQNRIAGLQFKGGVFTNISHDHLDYHQSFDEYLRVKKVFFDRLSQKGFALTNIDDKRGKIMLQNTVAKKYTYSLKTTADFRGKVIENTFDGLILHIDGEELHSGLIGEFNGYNLLTTYAVAKLLEQDKIPVLRGLSNLKGAEGRFEHILSEEKIIGIVDYAHTPDALEKVLATIEKVRTKNEKVIIVVGCGGDRDKAKRPLMAKIACEYGDQVLLTSDNPRSEDPEVIIKDMQAGVLPHQAKKVLAITNRKEAIKTACSIAQPADIVLIAGKGHEKYQEINGMKYPFDDKEILMEALKAISY